jgi:hypothetical protein
VNKVSVLIRARPAVRADRARSLRRREWCRAHRPGFAALAAALAVLFAALGEELAQHLPALVGQHARHELGVVIELAVGEQVDHRAGGAGLRIEGTEDDALEARVDQRHRAHRAWLQRHVELALRQAVVGQQRRRMAQGDDLRMGGRVVLGDRPVVAGGHDLPARRRLAHDHRAHRNLAHQPGVAGLVDGDAHGLLVLRVDHAGLSFGAHSRLSL